MVERGFTLMEICIALAIVAILSALAINQYQSHVIRSRQGAAKVDLLALLNEVERTNNPSASAAYDSAYYRFSTQRLSNEETGFAIWLVQAVPQGIMRGTGSLGVDSRGFSCHHPGQDAPCVPQQREHW